MRTLHQDYQSKETEMGAHWANSKCIHVYHVVGNYEGKRPLGRRVLGSHMVRIFVRDLYCVWVPFFKCVTKQYC